MCKYNLERRIIKGKNQCDFKAVVILLWKKEYLSIADASTKFSTSTLIITVGRDRAESESLLTNSSEPLVLTRRQPDVCRQLLANVSCWAGSSTASHLDLLMADTAAIIDSLLHWRSHLHHAAVCEPLDTHVDRWIHMWTAGYTCGPLDTHVNHWIHMWTYGYTCEPLDTHVNHLQVNHWIHKWTTYKSTTGYTCEPLTSQPLDTQVNHLQVNHWIHMWTTYKSTTGYTREPLDTHVNHWIHKWYTGYTCEPLDTCACLLWKGTRPLTS